MTILWTGPAARAEALAAAVSMDDAEMFSIHVEHHDSDQATISIQVHDERLRTIRATVDDLLACLAAADSALDESTHE